MPTGIALHKSLAAYKRLGERVRQARIDAGLTQTQLANLAGVGHDALSKLELGRSRVEVMVIVELAEVLNQDVVNWMKD